MSKSASLSYDSADRQGASAVVGGSASSRLQRSGQMVLNRLTANVPSFVLLDFPHHDNIGDSAIWLGEVDYFLTRNLRPAYVGSVNTTSWQQVDANAEDGPIFLHGGGNFGDIWSQFQEFRESALGRYRGRRVIQLPQSIQYDDPARIDVTARAIEAHGNFTLLVRDEESLDLARRRFQCETLLCPDMAFQIQTLPGRVKPSQRRLLHLRTDKESALSPDATMRLAGQGQVADWPDDPFRIERVVLARTLARLLFSGRLFPPRRPVAREELYRQLATLRVRRGVALLTSAGEVLTDRLHGHILCTMLGLPHWVIDNSYGKIGRFARTWSTDVGGSLLGFFKDGAAAAAELGRQ